MLFNILVNCLQFVMSKMKIVLLIIPLIGLNIFAGDIRGIVVDNETGDPLIGANVYLENTLLGAASDLDGHYFIENVPVGTYRLIFETVGYSRIEINNVVIKGEDDVQLDITATPEILSTEAIIIEAKAIQNTEAALLKQRQKSSAISDAISSEAISNSASSDAADAMKLVTGASIIEGKYAVIRGLGDRYTSTALNGAVLPTADPDKKAVQMDMFPSNLLDNIVTQKTFTPDKPGNFTGGMINVVTKDYPEKFTLKVSASTSYNSIATHNDNFLTYDGSDTDWLGYDDGSRDVPDYLEQILEQGEGLPGYIQARRDSAIAETLHQTISAVNPQMVPTTKQPPSNKSYSLSVGDQVKLFNRPIGYTANFIYGRNYSFYENGVVARWNLPGQIHENTVLHEDQYLFDARGKQTVKWGGMLFLSSKLHDYHEVGVNYYHTQSGESEARYLYGRWLKQITDSTYNSFHTRTISYIERNLKSLQFHGEHFFPVWWGAKLNWNYAISKNYQNEPDVRYFSNSQTDISRGGPPSHYFRYLDEKGNNYGFDLEFPFRQWDGLNAKFKLGGSFNKKERTFEQSLITYRGGHFASEYDPTDPEFFQPGDNAGVIGYDSLRNQYMIGLYLINQYSLGISPDHKGEESISAGYSMVDMPITRDLRFIGGARFEETKMVVNSTAINSSDPEDAIHSYLFNRDWLPSVNLVYQLKENMNLRGGYGKTLARPILRELTNYETQAFHGDMDFYGNDTLQRTITNNYDLRWEWFINPGEILAVSGFYKQLTNPIEYIIVGNIDFPKRTLLNVDEGRVYGVEFEFRKGLYNYFKEFNNAVLKEFRNVQLGVNFTFVESKVDIPDAKIASFASYDSTGKYFTETTRPLQGQSPYILNINLGYENVEKGTNIYLYYNLFGKRLTQVMLDANPDVYEKPYGTLDLIFGQRFWDNFKFKVSLKNIMAESRKFVQEFKDKEYIRQQYKSPTVISMGLSYEY